MAKSKPTYKQARLLLQIYDLRREQTIRRARDWFLTSFRARTLEELEQAAPQGSQENAYLRMLLGYWEQACMFLNQDLLDQEQFFTTSGEFYMVWMRVEPLVESFRLAYKNPRFFFHLETAARKFEKWQDRIAPESRAILQQRLKEFMEQTAPSKK